jgi:hypothetical protein
LTVEKRRLYVVGAIACPAKAALASRTRIETPNDIARIETSIASLCETSSNNIYNFCDSGIELPYEWEIIRPISSISLANIDRLSASTVRSEQ